MANTLAKTMLIIKYAAEREYDEWLLTCSVTYPSVLNDEPFTVDYSEEGETPQEVLASMSLAIADYIAGPQDFERSYITGNTDEGRLRRMFERDLNIAYKRSQEARVHVEECDLRVQRLQQLVDSCEEEYTC